jgi:hypothetical protein
MGLIKNVVTAFKPSNLAQGLAAARNPPSAAEIEASLATLTPEQRAAYDANTARVEAGRHEAEASWQAAKELDDASRPLKGPAGRYLYGAGMGDVGSPAEIEALVQEQGVFAAAKQLRAAQHGDLGAGARQALNRPAVAQLSDPAERARVAASERAGRDAARAPFVAGVAPQVAFTRIATRGGTQLAEVLAWLGDSGLGPTDLYGLYRVPDRISTTLTPHSEQGRVVEWDVVHGPERSGSGELEVTSFVARDQWVARRLGERAILDEDLPAAFLAEAGIGPERCAGIARMTEFRELRGGDAEESAIRTLVTGVVALHEPDARQTFAGLRERAPLALDGPPPGVHVEVLNWEEIGRAVHAQIYEPPSCPSPFPYLPSTPQELLQMYVEVVGLRPTDCYGAQATVDRPRVIQQGGLFTKNWGSKQPCADGKARTRAAAGQVVVLVYRDAPEYVAGRGRWAAYCEQVLQARLDAGLDLRPALVDGDDVSDLPFAPLRAAARVAGAIDRISDLGAERVPPYRYCWPPVG